MEIRNKKILVTGGLGFIGSHIVESLVEQASKVVVYDNFTSGNIDNLAGISKEIEIIRGDILDYEKLRKIMRGMDIVSHQAAELEVLTGISDMRHDLKVNTEGTLNVLTACMKNDVEKLIYASSGAVYGQARYIPEDEGHPLDPHWPYGVSKLAGEKYCSMAWNLYKLPTVSLRYAIAYGPREWYGRVLTLFIKRCLQGEAPVIFGDGRQTRDFVYITDVVEAHNAAIRHEQANGKVFNIASGSGISMSQLADMVIECTGLDAKAIWDNPPEGEESSYQLGRRRLVGELKDFVLDISQARKVLNFNPVVDKKKGISNEIEWIRNQPDRWVRPRV